MAVPDFQSFFKPLLDMASDGIEHSLRDAREVVAKKMALTQDDMLELLPSGMQSKFDNRLAWAKSYLVQAKVLETPRRAFFKITERGMVLHRQGHNRIDIKILNQYEEFRNFHNVSSANKEKAAVVEVVSDETPEETLQSAYQNIRADLASELLSKVVSNSPRFFENLVVDLMIAMGYGGSRVDAGKTIGQSGDEGIDGIINEDKLGLDIIYLQAKRWQNTVGRPDVQKFVGALHGKRAKKGVFITTGAFSADAKNYVESIDPKVILIDGRQLADFMIDYGVGVSTTKKYEIKRVDSDYFEEN